MRKAKVTNQQNVTTDNIIAPAKKNTHLFSYIAMSFTVVLVIIITIIISMLWASLDKFERSSPEFALEEFVHCLLEKSPETTMKIANIKSSTFFTPTDYQEFMLDKLGEEYDKIKLVKIDEGELKYQLLNPEKSFINITLQKSEDSGTFYKILQEPISKSSIKIIAPEYAKISANGVFLDEKYRTNGVKPIKQFDTIIDKNGLPTQVCYEIKDFIKQPQIVIDGVDKDNMVVTNDNGIMEIMTLASVTQKPKIEAVAHDATLAYANFIQGDKPFEFYADFLKKETEHYKRMRAFDNQWATVHTGLECTNFSYENTFAFSDKHFSTEVHFDCILMNGKQKRVYPSIYKFSFLKEGTAYKIVNLEVT